MPDLDDHPVIASMALPMTTDADIDSAALTTYTHWLVEHEGLNALAINGDTGEGAHLTVEERLHVTRTVRAAAGSDVLLVAGLHGTSTRAAVALASAYREAGADVLLPFGIPGFAGLPLPPALVGDYHAALAMVGLPMIGFSLTRDLGGTVYTPDILAELGKRGLLVGLKEASFDAAQFVASRDALRRDAPGVHLLSGSDNFVYESFVLGARGCLLGLAGIAGRLTAEILHAVTNGQVIAAEKLNEQRYRPLAEAMFAPAMRDNRARIKEGLRHLGVIPSATVRPPLAPIADSDRDRMLAAVDLVHP